MESHIHDVIGRIADWIRRCRPDEVKRIAGRKCVVSYGARRMTSMMREDG